jgi:hypothetical protein
MFIALAGLWRAGALISARGRFLRGRQFVIYATRAEKRRRDNNARINPILFVARDDRAVVVLRANAIKTRPAHRAPSSSPASMIYNRRIYEAADHQSRDF